MKLLIITKTVDEQDQLLGFFVEWLRLFANKFEKVEVLCLVKGKYSLPSNVAVHEIGKYQGISKLKYIFNFYFLIFTLRNKYDVVFVHMNPIWMVVGGIFWKITRKKSFLWYTSGGVTPKLKIAEKFADTILTASKESFRLPSKKIIVTGHGIDTGLFKPDISKLNFDRDSKFNFRILSVGRIALVKNYEILIDAAKILKDKGINFSVTMVGEAPLEGDRNYEVEIRSKIKNLGLENNFNFVGKVNHNDLPKYYQSHDIFIHLSKTGSLDKTILEAMSCGMKVLSSSDVSKPFLPPELIFNDSDSVELAEKIIALANANPDNKLREYVVQHHNLDKLVDKISLIIKS